MKAKTPAHRLVAGVRASCFPGPARREGDFFTSMRPRRERRGKSRQGLPVAVLNAQLSEVLLDDLAIPLGHVSGEFPHVGLTLARGQSAPLLGQILDLLGVDLTRTAVGCNVRVPHRAARPIGVARRTAGSLTTAGSGTTVGSVAVLVLELLDDLVQACDNFLLELLGLLAT